MTTSSTGLFGIYPGNGPDTQLTSLKTTIPHRLWGDTGPMTPKGAELAGIRETQFPGTQTAPDISNVGLSSKAARHGGCKSIDLPSGEEGRPEGHPVLFASATEGRRNFLAEGAHRRIVGRGIGPCQTNRTRGAIQGEFTDQAAKIIGLVG